VFLLFNVGPWELVLILFIALVIFGPGKLPEVAKGMGKAVKEFKQASTGIQKQLEEAVTTEEPAIQIVTATRTEVAAPKEETRIKTAD
jgi:sec-independent protein translocase protein TatA